MRKADLTARDFLLHMLEACDRILLYTKEMSRADFDRDTRSQDAVIRNVEIIGEAANNLMEADPEIAVHYPQIPFAQIYGMRNRVAHGYFAVSLAMIWDTVEIDLPELRTKILALLSDIKPSSKNQSA